MSDFDLNFECSTIEELEEAMQKIIRASKDDEAEECAKIAESVAASHDKNSDDQFVLGCRVGANEVAIAINERLIEKLRERIKQRQKT